MNKSEAMRDKDKYRNYTTFTSSSNSYSNGVPVNTGQNTGVPTGGLVLAAIVIPIMLLAIPIGVGVLIYKLAKK